MNTPVEGGDHGAMAATKAAPRGAPKQQDLFPKEGAPVKIDRRKLPKPKKLPTARFWVGTMPEVDGKPNPIYQVSKGVAFQRYAGNPEIRVQNNEAKVVGRPTLGTIVELTKEQYDLVLERVGQTVVRNVRTHDRVSMTSPRFRPMAGDKPLGRFVYMVRLGEKMDPDFRANPTPMIE